MEAKRLAYITRVVAYIATESIITAIQLENEPFNDFGLCGSAFPIAEEVLKREVDAVRQADTLSRPIVTTVNGDAIDWTKTATFGDILAFTFYGFDYDSGVFFDHTARNGSPEEWRARGVATGKIVKAGEVQAEDWWDLKNPPPHDPANSMNPHWMRKNLKFVLDTGVTDVNFWGAEWWLYLKDQGRTDMWDAAKAIFAE